MAWGNVFDLGDTLQNVAVIKSLQQRSQYLEEERAREAEKARVDALDRQQKEALRKVTLQKMMARDMVGRAQAEGLSGPDLNARVMELFPAYQRVYSGVGGDWGDATPDAILALGMDTDAEDEARKARLIEQAKYGVRDQYGDTPIDQAALRDRSELMNDQRDQQNRLAFEDYTSKLRRGDDEYKSKLRREEDELSSKLRQSEADVAFSRSSQQPKLTESQERSRMLAQVGRAGQKALIALLDKGYDPTSLMRGGIDKMTAGTSLNPLSSPEGQAYKSAGNAIVSSILYKLSGAQATKDEIEKQAGIYLPMPGDSPEQKQQKIDFIENTLSSMEGGVPGYAAPETPTGGRKPLPTGFVELPDGRVRGPDGRMYRRAGM